MNYKFWDFNSIQGIRVDIIENIKDILSAVIGVGDSYKLKNAVFMAYSDDGASIDKVVSVGLSIRVTNLCVLINVENECTGEHSEETLSGYCVDSLLVLRNQLLKEIVTPIYEKIEDIAGSIGIKSLPEDFIVTIDDISYGDSFKAVVKHIANNVCKDGGVEIYVVPVDESISKEELKFPDTAIATIKEFKELVDFADKEFGLGFLAQVDRAGWIVRICVKMKHNCFLVVTFEKLLHLSTIFLPDTLPALCSSLLVEHHVRTEGKVVIQ